MTDPSTVVYDLDGTLVNLRVDWDRARDAVAAVYEEAGLDADGAGLWELLERSERDGVAAAVEKTIAQYERAGAHRSERLPTAAEMAAENRLVGVCSLNCEAACRIALDRHDLDAHVGAVVGRDSVSEYKPHPEPLLAAVRALGVRPSDALFVGDSERDLRTAERAGIQFAYVDGAPSGH